MKTKNTTNSRPAWQLWNSTAGTYTRRDVIRAAWTVYAAAVREFMCSTYSDVRQPRHDQRFKFNREAEAAARQIIAAKCFNGIMKDRQTRRDRIRAKGAEERRPRNILAAAIVRDYIQNRHDLRRVCADRLDFYGRNHWAKDDRDRKILTILSRNFARYNAARTLADGCKIDNYKAFGLNGRNGITEATATDSNGRKIARIYRGPLGYQAETLAMNYASQWHATERAALSALFISKEFAYLRQ